MEIKSFIRNKIFIIERIVFTSRLNQRFSFLGNQNIKGFKEFYKNKKISLIGFIAMLFFILITHSVLAITDEEYCQNLGYDGGCFCGNTCADCSSCSGSPCSGVNQYATYVCQNTGFHAVCCYWKPTCEVACDKAHTSVDAHGTCASAQPDDFCGSNSECTSNDAAAHYGWLSNESGTTCTDTCYCYFFEPCCKYTPPKTCSDGACTAGTTTTTTVPGTTTTTTVPGTTTTTTTTVPVTTTTTTPGSTTTTTTSGLSGLNLPNKPVSDIIADLVDWLLTLVTVIAILMLVIGGVMYLVATGDEMRLQSAKRIIVYAIVGLFVCGISYIIVKTIADIITK